MARRDWTHEELTLAMNLYCQLPFGRLHKGNSEIIALATVIGRTPSSVAMKLCNLASLDPAHQQRGVKGLSSVSKGDREIWQEFHSDWERLSVESESLRERLGITFAPAAPESERRTSEGFIGNTEGSRTVKVRLAQRFFRTSVLASYQSRCCVTDIALPSLLIASHILPWSGFPAHRADPRNGLCLSRIHDAAFDQGLVTFDGEYRLILSRELRYATTNEVLRASFLAFEGRPMRLPEKFQPDPTFLEKHRAEVFRG